MSSSAFSIGTATPPVRTVPELMADDAADVRRRAPVHDAPGLAQRARERLLTGDRLHPVPKSQLDQCLAHGRRRCEHQDVGLLSREHHAHRWPPGAQQSERPSAAPRRNSWTFSRAPVRFMAGLAMSCKVILYRGESHPI